MGLIPQSFVDELIGRADIVEIIGSRVQLKKAGREHKACCPFHNEKTPSFWVSPEKQFYHCFGCGAHGTALGFLMQYDQLSFLEAIDDLAARLGLEVPREGPSAGPARHEQDALYDTMAQVAQSFVEALGRDARARAYVARRGLEGEIVSRFGIGYSVNSWHDLLRRFGTNEEARRRLVDLGLIIERDRGEVREGERHYDRFRDRLMFPIRDARGRAIGFGGRVIDQGEPKYLNSPETELFHKGRELYGLHEARRSGAKLERLLVVEGYMDVVRLHQAGITYAVATLGTATTAEHLKKIFRLVKQVVFAFDGDRAGRAAGWRALQNALPEAREGREIRFMFLPDGQDPDTLVGSEGREAFESRLETSLPLSEYLVRELATAADLSHADGRGRFAEAARPLVAKVAPGVYRELLLGRVAEAIRLPAERLHQLWSTAAGSTPDAPPAVRRPAARASAGRGSLVRQAIVQVLHFPAVSALVSAEERAGIDRLEEPGAELLRALLDELRENPAQISAQVIERWVDKPGRDALVKLLQREEVISDATAAAAELRAALHRLAELVATRRLEALQAKLRTAPPLDREELEEYRKLTGKRPV